MQVENEKGGGVEWVKPYQRCLSCCIRSSCRWDCRGTAAGGLAQRSALPGCVWFLLLTRGGGGRGLVVVAGSRTTSVVVARAGVGLAKAVAHRFWRVARERGVDFYSRLN